MPIDTNLSFSAPRVTRSVLDPFGIACLFVFLVMCGGCVDHPPLSEETDMEYRERFEFTRAGDQRVELTLSNVNGSVVVRGSESRASLLISGFKAVRDRTMEDAKAHIGDIRIQITDSPTSITVNTEQPSSNGDREYRVDYVIELPGSWKVTLKCLNGNTTVSGMQKTMSLAVTNGLVDVRDASGDLLVDVGNGSIEAGLILPESASCILNTLNGSVALEVPKSTSAEVTARVTNGTISYSQLPLKVTSSSRTSLSGTLGRAKGKILLTTLNGTIRLSALD